MGLCSVELHQAIVLETISLFSLAMGTLHRKLGQNRPFYRYGGHIELRSIIGCPRGMSTFRLYSRALFGKFFLQVFLE